MGQPIAITGLGCIAAPGSGLEAQRSALEAGSCHLTLRPLPQLPLTRGLPCGHVTTALPRFPARTATLGVEAARQALRQTGIATQDCGVIVGSCTAGLPESEIAFAADPEAASPVYQRQQSQRLTHMIADALRCHGPRSTHSVACASAACAIAEASEWIRQRLCPAVLVVGVDALTRVTTDGFHALKLIDAHGCRPLTRERGGMSLGEGAAALLLEDADHARQRGAPAIASLLGWGMRADAYHATSPDPSGEHLLHAIDTCLGDAGLTAQDIDYVSAHGTGTIDNDGNELAVLARRFGAIPTASCKRSYGHTLGAAAAIEAVAACLAIRHQRRWASAGATDGTPLAGVEVLTHTRMGPVRAVISSTLAFGGANAALCFGGAERVA